MKQIVLIDDDPNLLASLERHFRRYRDEWKLLTAPDGNQALKLVRQHPVDLVIADILMPEMDGIETIAELGRSHPSIKVIAISGGGRHVGKEYLGHARRLGAHQTFEKPFDPAELMAAVETLLATQPDCSPRHQETT